VEWRCFASRCVHESLACPKRIRTFARVYREKVTSAIAQLPDPSSESFTSDISVDTDLEGADSQETATSTPSSQDIAGFMKPLLPPTVILQQENDR
jgi:hypothetical protein